MLAPGPDPVSAQPAALLPEMLSLLLPGHGERTPRPQDRGYHLLGIGMSQAVGPGSATDPLGTPSESKPSVPAMGPRTR